MLTNVSLWVWVVIPFIGGFLGVATHAIRNNNTIIIPKKNKDGLHLGVISDIFWGIVGAFSLVLVMIISPNGDIGALLFAIVGGIGGSKVVLAIVKKLNELATLETEKYLDKPLDDSSAGPEKHINPNRKD